jgi:hypothetical protein
MPKLTASLFCAVAALFLPVFAPGQGLLLPFIPQQFFDENGVPLAGGKLYQCPSLGACPGTQQATYNSSSLSTVNDNPLTLDGSGRAPMGIWLTPGLGYTFVTTTAQGAVVSTMLNVYGGITSVPASSMPCGTGSSSTASQIQYYGSSTSFGCSSDLTYNPATQTLGVTGTTGQAAVSVYSGYFQSYGGFLSTVPNGGVWNAFNSPTDGALLRGYSVQQTTANTSGGYLDIAPISYNPYNGSQCLDQFGNPVQQPLPLNGLSGFGANDVLLWAGTSPSMPSSGSCGTPLPVSPDQTYQGIPGQAFGLFTNAYFLARGGIATDNPKSNSIQSLLGGAYLKLGLTTDQAVYLHGYSTTTPLNNPPNPYGAIAYQGGDVFYYFNDVSGTWKTTNFASGGGGGGTAQGPANAIQANDPAGMGSFTGYAWLLAIPGSQAISALGGFTTTSGTGACALYNCIQAPVGGIYAGLGVTADQAFYPKAFPTTSGLNPPALGYGGLTYAGAGVGSGATYRYYNAATPGWAQVDFSVSGSGCTISGAAAGQVVFVNTGGSTCTTSTNLAWSNSIPQLAIEGGTASTQSLVIGTGYGLANGGWNSGTCTSSSCIQAPNGGLLAGLGVTANQAFYPFGYSSSASLNNPASGYGGFGYTGSGLNYWVWNATNSTWNTVNLGAGGPGGSCPAGAVNYLQFNNGSGGCGASANLTFNSSTNVLNLGGSMQILGTPAINTSDAFVGTGGVNTTGSVIASGGGQFGSNVVIDSSIPSTSLAMTVNVALRELQNTAGVWSIGDATNYWDAGYFASLETSYLTWGASTSPAYGSSLNSIGGATFVGQVSANSGIVGSIQTSGGILAQGSSSGSLSTCTPSALTAVTFANTNCEFAVNSAGTIFTSGIFDTGGAQFGNTVSVARSVGSVGALNINPSTGDLYPSNTDLWTLGDSSHTFQALYTAGIINSGIGGNTLNIAGIADEIYPTTNGSWSLGDSSHYFANIYVNGLSANGHSGETHTVVIGGCTMNYSGGLLYSTSGC